MSRGGARQGAGRKSTWASGCSRDDTIPIRVPKYLKDKVWDYAHRLDIGEDLESVVKLLNEENEQLRQQIEKMRTGKQISSGLPDEQLSLFDSSSTLPDRQVLSELRDRSLSLLGVGVQSKMYKSAKKAFDYFINSLFE
jgi:hypothetical protein